MRTKDIKSILEEYFFVNPRSKLRVRELERKLKLPLPSVIRYCKELVKENMLKIEKIGNVKFYTADRGSKLYVLEKKLYNLKTIYQSGLIDNLKQELSNPPIVLFGSYAKGEDTEDSDIDIYLETQTKKKITLEKFKKILKREIQIFQYKNLKEIANKHLANNIVNGITLNSNLEVFK